MAGLAGVRLHANRGHRTSIPSSFHVTDSALAPRSASLARLDSLRPLMVAEPPCHTAARQHSSPWGLKPLRAALFRFAAFALLGGARQCHARRRRLTAGDIPAGEASPLLYGADEWDHGAHWQRL
jgi:hypothetical protein